MLEEQAAIAARYVAPQDRLTPQQQAYLKKIEEAREKRRKEDEEKAKRASRLGIEEPDPTARDASCSRVSGVSRGSRRSQN